MAEKKVAVVFKRDQAGIDTGQIKLNPIVEAVVPFDQVQGLVDIDYGSMDTAVREKLWPNYGTEDEYHTPLGHVIAFLKRNGLTDYGVLFVEGERPDPAVKKVEAGAVVNKTESDLVADLKVQRIAEVKALAARRLEATDWKVLRHLGQKAAGVTTSMTDAEYQALETERQGVRDLSDQLEAEISAKLKVSTVMAVDVSGLEGS